LLSKKLRSLWWFSASRASHRGPAGLGPIFKDWKLLANAKGALIACGNVGLPASIAAIANAWKGEFLSILDNPIQQQSLRKTALSHAFVIADAFQAEIPTDLDACILVVSPNRIQDVLEEFLPERIVPRLRNGAIVVLPFVRDASPAGLKQLTGLDDDTRTALHTFANRQLGKEKIDSIDEIADRFAADGLELITWLPGHSQEPAHSTMVWLVLRRSEALGRRKKAGFPRTSRVDRFPLNDFKRFVIGIKDAKIALLPVDRFARRFLVYQKNESKIPVGSSSFGLLKFDIHGNIRRPLEMARILSALHIPGIFLMMHRHPINEAFYDSPETWQILREIADGGHEVGIHIDPFYLVRAYGDLYEGLRSELKHFRDRGVKVRSATLHGDSRPHIKLRRLQSNDFFREEFRKIRWDGKPPKGEEYLAEHVKRYSHRELAQSLGIKFFPELNFLRNGERLNARHMSYISDNTRHITANRLWGNDKQLTVTTPFRITEKFVTKTTTRLKRQPFLVLLHPQWYW